MSQRRALVVVVALIAFGGGCTALNGVSEFTECSDDCEDGSTSGLDANAETAPDSATDSTELDSTTTDSTEIDSTEIDSTTTDSTTTDSTTTDSTVVDTTVVDTTVVVDTTPPPDTAVADTALVDVGDTGFVNNVVFITSSAHAANFGSPTVADGICAMRASEAGLKGNFRAFLATSGATAASRLGTARGWVRVDGRPFGDTVTSIIDSNAVLNPTMLSEKGVPVNEDYWTGTNTNGTTDTSRTCADWMSASATSAGRVGHYGGGPGSWMSGAFSYFCSSSMHFICFGIDSNKPLVVTTSAGKRIFASSGVNSGMGRAAFDTACATEATAAGLTGTYKAVVSTSTEAASARINPTANYVRPDGQLVGTGAQILAQSPLSGVWQRAGGMYLQSWTVWLGAPKPTATSAIDESCTDFTLTTGAGSGGNLWSTTAFWSGVGASCVGARAVYCAEQ